MDKKVYTVFHVLDAQCTLEPIICLNCGKTNVQFFQNLGDAFCEDCGMWQLEIPIGNVRISEEVANAIREQVKNE